MAASVNNTSNGVNIIGTTGDDTIVNSGHNVTIQGAGGDDTITSTGTGANTFRESASGDVIINASGDTGTAGGDVFSLHGGTSTIMASAGDDTINTGTAQEVGSANDFVMTFAGAGNDHIHLGSVTGGGSDIAYGGAGNDIIDFAGHSVATIFGGAGDDTITLTGSGGGSFVSADDGNDMVFGSATGSDTVFGGTGDDTLTGAAAATHGSAFYGNAGNDVITVSDALSAVADTLFGGQGDDTLTATGTNNAYISGDLGNDSITGGMSGADSLYGGMGDDTIHGGTAAADASTIFGGQGNDLIVATGSGAHELSGDVGNDTIDASGSSGADTIYGGVGADSISLGTGHETVVIHVGDSTGSESSTTVSGTTTTIVNGESNLDHILGFVTGDTLVVGGHNDLVVAGAHANFVDHVDAPATAPTDEAHAYQAAYAYAFGSTAGAANFSAGTEYLAVHETTAGGQAETYLFTHDGAAVAFDNNINFTTGGTVVGG